MTIIYVLLVAHFIGDFVLQTDAMAINKSKRWDALTWHVAIYTMVLAVIVAFSQPDSEYPYATLTQFGYFVGVNGILHFVQDAITSRINARLWFFRDANPMCAGRGPVPVFHFEFIPGLQRHWFFVGIGADQLLHYVTLFVTAGWWLQ